MARLPNIGEKSTADFIDQRNVLNRTIRAQISDVNNENGYVIVNYEGLPGGGRYATVSPLWASFPESGGAAWGRYMPHRSDVVKLSFDYDDAAHVVGYDVVAGDQATGNGRTGWHQINALYKRAKANPDDKIEYSKNGEIKSHNLVKYSKFVPLNPGEYDFMSSGDAYIYGNDKGKLYLAGGSVSIALTKEDLLMMSSAQLMMHKADNCEFRFGQLRQTDDLKPTDTHDKEFRVSIKTDGDAPVDVARLYMGNVGDMRYSVDVYGSSGVAVCTNTIDSSGNYTISSPSIKLQGPAGSPAIHPLLLTNIYRAAEDTAVTGLATQIATLAAAVTALSAGVVSLAAAYALVPILTPQLALPQVATPLAAAIAAVTASGVTSGVVTAGTPAIATAFTTAGPSYLSQIVKTG